MLLDIGVEAPRTPVGLGGGSPDASPAPQQERSHLSGSGVAADCRGGRAAYRRLLRMPVPCSSSSRDRPEARQHVWQCRVWSSTVRSPRPIVLTHSWVARGDASPRRSPPSSPSATPARSAAVRRRSPRTLAASRGYPRKRSTTAPRAIVVRIALRHIRQPAGRGYSARRAWVGCRAGAPNLAGASSSICVLAILLRGVERHRCGIAGGQLGSGELRSAAMRAREAVALYRRGETGLRTHRDQSLAIGDTRRTS